MVNYFFNFHQGLHSNKRQSNLCLFRRHKFRFFVQPASSAGLAQTMVKHIVQSTHPWQVESDEESSFNSSSFASNPVKQKHYILFTEQLNPNGTHYKIAIFTSQFHPRHNCFQTQVFPNTSLVFHSMVLKTHTNAKPQHSTQEFQFLNI